MQSVAITTNVVSWNPTHAEVYLIQYYVSDFSPCTPVPSTSTIGHHDITEILLKVGFNTIILTLYLTMY